jgi:hypothetical protein
VDSVRTLIDRGSLTEASQRVEELSRVAPDNANVIAAKEALSVARRAAPAGPSAGHSISDPDRGVMVRSTFCDGQLAESVSLAADYGATDARIAALGQQIADFQAAFAAPDADRVRAEQAAALDMAICRGRTVFGPRYQVLLAPKNLSDGLKFKSAGDLRAAFAALRRAQLGDPANAECRAALEELRVAAQNTYQQGLLLRAMNPDEAKKKFDEVIPTPVSNDETHAKAVARLQELGT